jgi:ATP-dependent DNA helicase RecG
MLVEAGLIEAHGIGKGRTYTLSAKVYRATGQMREYVRQIGLDESRQEQKIIQHVKKEGKIKRAKAMEECKLSAHQASRLLRRMHKEGKLVLHGKRKGAFYTLP